MYIWQKKEVPQKIPQLVYESKEIEDGLVLVLIKQFTIDLGIAEYYSPANNDLHMSIEWINGCNQSWRCGQMQSTTASNL